MNKLLISSLLILTGCWHVPAQTPPATPEADQLISKTSGPAPASAAPDDTPTAKTPALLAAEKSKPIRLPRFDKGPNIDGKLDDEVWKSAVVLKDFFQINPGDNTPPSRPTEVLLGYDAQSLYCAFRAFDDPEKVRANIAKRDAVLDDDYVSLYLDTFNDRRRAYELSFNPLGIQQDGIITEGRGTDFNVDIVMESKGALNQEGYVVEIAVPFKSLRYKAGEGRSWGVHFFRRIKRFNNELSSWMPVSRDKSGLLYQAGTLTDLTGLASERVLEVIPSLTLIERGRRVSAWPLCAAAPSRADAGRFVNRPMAVDPGLTLKLNLASSLVFDFAANPDFAQVEADQSVIRVNERFPIFFAEKRPFFLEGADIFQTPLNAVHTRTIIDPDVAAKLTGKRGRNTFGILLASDNAPGNFSEDERNDPALAPSIAPLLDKNSYVGVLRLKRDVGKESSVGFLGTGYRFTDRHNYVGGVDGRFRLDAQTFFSFQVLGTSSRASFFDPDEGRDIHRVGNAVGYSYLYDRSGRHLVLLVKGEGFSRDYRTQVGFTRRTDTNLFAPNIKYRSEPNPAAKLISWVVQNPAFIRFDWQGRLQRWEQFPQFTLELPRQTSVNPYFFFGYERLFEEEFGQRRSPTRPGAFSGHSERGAYYKGLGFSFSTTPTKKLSLLLDSYYNWGQFDFDFGGGRRFPRVSPSALSDPGAPLDPGPGNQFVAVASFTYQPVKQLAASFDYTKIRLVRNDTGLLAFDSDLYSLRTTYQFTRFTHARARIDYDSLEGSLREQFLFGWTPNPGTSFYVGYNDDLSYNGFSPFTGHREPGFRRNSRAFFIKMTYLFRRSL